jgi:hypothetical protein
MDGDGEWPSGKALGSGPRIGGSNPSSPASIFVSVEVGRLSGTLELCFSYICLILAEML